MLSLLVGAVFGCGWIPLFLYRAEERRQALPFYAGAERFWVNATPLILAAHVTLACVLVSLTEPLPRLRTALALALFGGAIAFWFRARRQIGSFDRRPLPNDPPPALRRDGPFGLVRHPLYFAYLLAAAAPALVAWRPILLVTWAAACGALAIRAAQEERRLHGQLGAEYAAYCRAVKRLVPFVW
jgi:protein-S-isoprenylcysteine O-methyltransferase Ste14